MPVKKITTRLWAVLCAVCLVLLLTGAIFLHDTAANTENVLNALDISQKLILLARALAVIFFCFCNALEYLRIQCEKAK